MVTFICGCRVVIVLFFGEYKSYVYRFIKYNMKFVTRHMVWVGKCKSVNA